MIVDLQHFITEERPYWKELEQMLYVREERTAHRMTVQQVKRFHYLYQRASADLAKVMGLSAETDIRRYLESLVSRAYSDVHEIRSRSQRVKPLAWFFHTFPQTFRRHIRAFWLAVTVTMMGVIFGGMALSFDPEAKAIIMPFSHLQGDPSERVAMEENMGADANDRLQGAKTQFSTYLMTHNTRVSIGTFAMGMTWGIGTIILLFYNGVILGAVAIDYILAGESVFLAGWLLPHGSIEIPAILLAGQAGFVLASALIGWGERLSLRQRLQRVFSDLMTLMFGLALMLVWAGIIEAFLSQYHAPVLPYAVKIGFGVVELIGLCVFLSFSGRSGREK
jgi:uncharacterized membrane protein SpoIIM required for sporulation